MHRIVSDIDRTGPDILAVTDQIFVMHQSANVGHSSADNVRKIKLRHTIVRIHRSVVGAADVEMARSLRFSSGVVDESDADTSGNPVPQGVANGIGGLAIQANVVECEIQ